MPQNPCLGSISQVDKCMFPRLTPPPVAPATPPRPFSSPVRRGWLLADSPHVPPKARMADLTPKKPKKENVISVSPLMT